MQLVQPALGLIFWMILSFGIVFFILKKFAWKPILKALDSRNDSIQEALDTAKKTRQEMAALKSEHQHLLEGARIERDVILKEAREAKDQIIAEAKQRAEVEGTRLIAIARDAIENQKMAAIIELQNQVAKMAIEMAEKIIRAELSTDERQRALVNQLVKEINPN